MKELQVMIQQLLDSYSAAELLGFMVILLIVIWVITIIFRTSGMISSLEQVVSTVIQQACSILIAGFQLTLRLLQAVQLYLILLVDILTGKSTSEQKVCVLASSALSIASFYTTYQGFCYIISIKTIAVLLTIGIQTLMLRTSLQLGMQMDWDNKTTGNFKRVLYGGILLLAFITIGYLLDKTNLLSFEKHKFVNYTIAYFCVLLVLWIFFSFIHSISNLRMKNKQTALYLFTIYFATLAVSSFFSFHAFFISLYPVELRMLDNFTEAKQSVISALGNINSQIDDKYYFGLSEDIQKQLNISKTEMEGTLTTNIESMKANMQSNDNDYFSYIEGMEKISDAKDEIIRLNTGLAEEKAKILGNQSNNIGYNTRTLIENLESSSSKLVSKQNDIIREQNEELKKNKFITEPALLKEYEDKKQALETLQNKSSLSDKISQANLLLAKDEWEQIDVDEFTGILNDIQNEVSTVNLTNILSVLGEYKQYRRIYGEVSNDIMALYLNEQSEDVITEYQEKRGMLFQYIYSLVNAVPRKNIMIKIGDEYRSTNIADLNIITIALEQSYADSNMERHIIQQNISSFWKARIPAFLSALIAVMVDNLILFVGLVSPRKVEFFKHILKDDPDNKKIILEHFFSKPVKKA